MIKDEIKKRRVDYRHFVCIILIFGCLVFSFFLFPHAFGRIIESFRDFGLSVAYYFCKMFNIENNISPTINDMPKYPFFDFLKSKNVAPPSEIIPISYNGFKSKWELYWELFVQKETFILYLISVVNFLYNLSYLLLIVLPFFLLLKFLFARYMQNKNNNYNKDSYCLKTYKKILKFSYEPIRDWLKNFCCFLKEYKKYLKIMLFIWLFNFNIITIIVEFAAYYFYFSASFDFSSIYFQIYKLFLDLSVPIRFIPVWCWVFVGMVLFLKFRINIAFLRLAHLEKRNKGFLNARSIVTFVCGTMGKSKTTTITDMALSQEVIFRNEAYKKILECDIKFPNFPWINFENAIKKRMELPVGEKGRIYNFATCELFINESFKKWRKSSTSQDLFDYDFKRYGILYDDKLKVINIWQALEVYAKMYFLYIIQSSLLISNYSIRVDNLFSDLGNFPKWNSDFFSRDSRLIDSYSRHAHILDFDMLRLGKKILYDNPNKDIFEFGVVVITEVGKERGNTVELKDKKKCDFDANQLNDLFNVALKMIRHPAVVDNYVFSKILVDEQRPSSWGADARELCEIVHIRELSETRLALPFFFFEELLYSLIFGKFLKLYSEYRYVRADNTLFMYLMKCVASKLDNYYKRIYNLFGYKVSKVDLEDGAREGEYIEGKYFLMFKKIYSKRFATDCYAEFFRNKSIKSIKGLNDLVEYSSEKASLSELNSQNSYFVNDISFFD